jgi:hypothetical protein
MKIKLETCDPRLRERIERQMAHENNTHRKVSNPIPERDQAPALDGPVPGKAQSHERARVRFTGYRVQPLDPDNFAGSVKDLLDGLRHAHILAGDEPWRIILETEQVRVPHFNQEKTVIEIEL